MTGNESVRVIVLKDGDTYIAQCLEYDLCAHAQDEKTLFSRFEALFNFERNLSIERNGAPFAGIDPAPREFHDMWDACEQMNSMNVAGAQVSLAKCAA